MSFCFSSAFRQLVIKHGGRAYGHVAVVGYDAMFCLRVCGGEHICCSEVLTWDAAAGGQNSSGLVRTGFLMLNIHGWALNFSKARPSGVPNFSPASAGNARSSWYL